MDTILLISIALAIGVIVGDVLYYAGKRIWSKTRYFIYTHSKTASPSDIWKAADPSKVKRIIENSVFGLGTTTQDSTQLARYLINERCWWTVLPLPTVDELLDNSDQLDISNILAKVSALEYFDTKKCENRIKSKIDIFEKETIL